MWEAISSNQRRSMVLLAAMALLLGVLGASVGVALLGDPVAGGVFGSLVAAIIWIVMLLIAYAGGDSVLLSAAGARRIDDKAQAPVLWNTIEEMTIASGLGRMPRVYIIDDDMANAFAVGRKPESASVAVTSGLLKRLNRDELQGVVAHEIGHIRNLDIRFMTYASVMLGAIVLISDIFLRSMFYGAGRRRSSRSDSGGGQAQALLMLVALLAAILAPIFAQLLYFSCSRRREYLADASAARFTRYPEGLASALEKIAGRGLRARQKVNRVIAPMYIVNPAQSMAAAGAFSTHPPVEKRIAVLRGMAGGAGYAHYEDAYRKVLGKGSECIGAQTLKSDRDEPIREPGADAESPSRVGAVPEKETAAAKAPARAAGPAGVGAGGPLLEGLAVLDQAAGMRVITCDCGMRLKLPPLFMAASVECPRCGRVHDAPASGRDEAGAARGSRR